jgi:hypothetical protein
MLTIDFDLLDVARNRVVISTDAWAQAGQETPDRHAEALARPGASPMEMNGRRYEGFVRVAPGLCTDCQLPDWVALAHAYVASLPPKNMQ